MKIGQEKTHMKNGYIYLKKLMYWKKKRNLVLMCQYLRVYIFVYVFSGHNANVKRIFSLIMAQWANRLQVKNIESIIQRKVYFKTICSELHMYEYANGKPKLLKHVK